MGYYYNQDFQLTLTLPPDWTVSEKENQVQFADPSQDLYLLVQTFQNDPTAGMDYLGLFVSVFRDPSLNIFASSSLGKKDEFRLGDGSLANRQVITGKHISGANLAMQITVASLQTQGYAFIFFGSDVSMSAKESLMDGIYETISLGKNAASLPALANADPVAGEWTGNAHGIDDPNFSTQVDISIQTGCMVGNTCGTYSAAQSSCSGDMILAAINGNTFTFIEKNTAGSSDCTTGGYEYVRMNPDGTLAWSFFYSSLAGESTASSATLQRK
jgi:hypothetical protein